MSILRQRIPWGTTGGTVNASEAEPLLAETGEVVGGEAIELAELGASEGIVSTFALAEGAGASLDATGIGAPIGIAIGLLAAIGYGGYEIYKHFIEKGAPPSQVPRPHVIDQHINNNKDQIEAHKQSLQSRGIVLPGSNYIGPGNSLDNGAPQSITDHIAKLHDIAYSKANNEGDIKAADKEFITDTNTVIAEGFDKDPISFGQAVVANVGIRAKAGIESLTGVKYPSNLSGKIWFTTDSHRNIIELTQSTEGGERSGIKITIKKTPVLSKSFQIRLARRLHREHQERLLLIVSLL